MSQRLQSKLHAVHLKIVNDEPHSQCEDCLFRAFSQQCFNTSKFARDVAEACANHQSGDMRYLYEQWAKDAPQACAALTHAVDLQALADAFAVQLTVITSDADFNFKPLPKHFPLERTLEAEDTPVKPVVLVCKDDHFYVTMPNEEFSLYELFQENLKKYDGRHGRKWKGSTDYLVEHQLVRLVRLAPTTNIAATQFHMRKTDSLGQIISLNSSLLKKLIEDDIKAYNRKRSEREHGAKASNKNDVMRRIECFLKTCAYFRCDLPRGSSRISASDQEEQVCLFEKLDVRCPHERPHKKRRRDHPHLLDDEELLALAGRSTPTGSNWRGGGGGGADASGDQEAIGVTIRSLRPRTRTASGAYSVVAPRRASISASGAGVSPRQNRRHSSPTQRRLRDDDEDMDDEEIDEEGAGEDGAVSSQAMSEEGSDATPNPPGKISTQGAMSESSDESDEIDSPATTAKQYRERASAPPPTSPPSPASSCASMPEDEKNGYPIYPAGAAASDASPPSTPQRSQLANGPIRRAYRRRVFPNAIVRGRPKGSKGKKGLRHLSPTHGDGAGYVSQQVIGSVGSMAILQAAAVHHRQAGWQQPPRAAIKAEGISPRHPAPAVVPMPTTEYTPRPRSKPCLTQSLQLQESSIHVDFLPNSQPIDCCDEMFGGTSYPSQTFSPFSPLPRSTSDAVIGFPAPAVVPPPPSATSPIPMGTMQMQMQMPYSANCCISPLFSANIFSPLSAVM